MYLLLCIGCAQRFRFNNLRFIFTCAPYLKSRILVDICLWLFPGKSKREREREREKREALQVKATQENPKLSP